MLSDAMSGLALPSPAALSYIVLVKQFVGQQVCLVGGTTLKVGPAGNQK